MYPFLTLDDDTEIVHSDMKSDGRVKIYIEKTDERDGFHHATIYLPDYTWEDIYGFDEEELRFFKDIVENSANLIIEFSKDGGFQNASGF